MKALLFISLLIFSDLTIAEDVGYEVEVIIFEDTSGLYKKSENWPVEEKISTDITAEPDAVVENKTTNDKELKETEALDKKIVFEFIDNEKYRLSKQALKLQENDKYNILYHKAWKQPGLDKDSAQPIIINTKKAENSESATEIETSPDELESFITGDFTLIMSRYLHVLSNIVIHKPADAILVDESPDAESTESNMQPDTEPYVKYPVIFERRMRSKEIHYIDHPMGGIIVLAVPYKIKVEEDAPVEGYKTL